MTLAPMTLARTSIALVLALGCAGCGGTRYAGRWNGYRGYDGKGDYGYDLAASRRQADAYRARAARSYPVPGTPADPWGPYIRQAAARFQVPEAWIRAVMQQESGGNLYDASGRPITSSAGAMGLMQVMPRTYDLLRQEYGLGDDPYAPHDNILAGTAYLREMYARFGSPAFLAAYNAGPDRVDAYLAGDGQLPDETVSYVASIAPELGMPASLGRVGGSGGVVVAASDAAYAGGGMTGADYAARAADQAYAGGGMSGTDYWGGARRPVSSPDPSLAAYAGGGLVTATAPTGVLLVTQPAEPVAPVVAVSRSVPVAPPPAEGWGIQVGAFPDPSRSEAAIAAARSLVATLLDDTEAVVMPVRRAEVLYRARLMGLSPDAAQAACSSLTSQGMACFVVRPGA